MKTKHRRFFKQLYIVMTVGLLCLSCGNKGESNLKISLSGIANLGGNYNYEGWLVINGIANSTGSFNIDANGNPSLSAFDFDERELQKASSFFITIEPNPDQDPAPSTIKVLSGAFNGSTAELSIEHSGALATDFSNIEGSYVLATPTDTEENNELSGVWFAALDSIVNASLQLPELPLNWTYESWAIIDDINVSMGTFSKVDSSDNSNIYSGALSGFNVPGEDFLQNAPASLIFPTDLTTQRLTITIEPQPDISSDPFFITLLSTTIDSNAVNSVSYFLENNTLPSGLATR